MKKIILKAKNQEKGYFWLGVIVGSHISGLFWFWIILAIYGG